MDVLERLLAMKVVLPNGCWTANRKLDSDGYVTFWWAGVTTKAHRAAYILFKGPLDRKIQVHHVCENRACFNPDHLEKLPPKEHKSRHRPTHCKYGHEFTEATTTFLKSGHRRCLICVRRYSREAMKQSRIAHPERQKASSRRYYLAHQEECKAKTAAYKRAKKT